MTESELLAELQILTATAPPERNGLFTTEEVARVLSAKMGITLSAATVRVRSMWRQAEFEGRLIKGRVTKEALDRIMPVMAYKLKGV